MLTRLVNRIVVVHNTLQINVVVVRWLASTVNAIAEHGRVQTGHVRFVLPVHTGINAGRDVVGNRFGEEISRQRRHGSSIAALLFNRIWVQLGYGS